MKRLILAMVLMAPQIALATDCSFVTECYEADECYDTAYDLTVTPSDDTATAMIETIAGNIEATAYNFEGMSSYAGATDSTLHVITLSDSGAARYAVHTGDEKGVTMITYHGTCTQ